jgi:hypothetical protein
VGLHLARLLVLRLARGAPLLAASLAHSEANNMPVDYSMILGRPSPFASFQQGRANQLQIQAAEQDALLKQQAAEAAQQQAEQQAAFNQAFGQAYQSKDPQALQNVIAQFPEQFEMVQKAIGIRDEAQGKALGSLGIQLSQLATQDPQAAAGLIMQNEQVLRNAGPGYEPESLLKQLQENPKALSERADNFALVALGPKTFFDVTGARAKVNAQLRGQDITMRGQDIQQQEGALDRSARLQAAQIRADATLADAAAKLQAGQQLGAKDLRQINSDLTTFTKEHTGMYSAAKDLETLRARNTPASQLAAIFKYMKALDPTSVVREGEQVMVQRTDGVFGSMANYVSQLQSGKRLNDDQMKDLEVTAKQLANSQAEAVNSSVDSYLQSYGGTLPEAQKKLLESRKAKIFEVEAPKKDKQQASQSGAPEVGTAADGYIFLGGDPADPASWRKQ